MCLLNRPLFKTFILVTIILLAVGYAEIQQNFLILQPEKLVPIYERKISINIDNLPPITVTAPICAEMVSTDRLLKAQINDEISAIHSEISATILPSELTCVPLYNAPVTTGNILGYTETFKPISIIRFENGFAKVAVFPEKACWIQNRFVLSDTVKKEIENKQNSIKLTIERSLGLQRLMYVERRPWATVEYISLGTGLGLCALGISLLRDKQESAFRPAGQTVGIAELICGGVFLYNLYQNSQAPASNYLYIKTDRPSSNTTITIEPLVKETL
jgi:hypothetical protein